MKDETKEELRRVWTEVHALREDVGSLRTEIRAARLAGRLFIGLLATLGTIIAAFR